MESDNIHHSLKSSYRGTVCNPLASYTWNAGFSACCVHVSVCVLLCVHLKPKVPLSILSWRKDECNI